MSSLPKGSYLTIRFNPATAKPLFAVYRAEVDTPLVYCHRPDVEKTSPSLSDFALMPVSSILGLTRRYQITR